MKVRRIHLLLGALVLAVCAIPFRAQLRRPVVAVIQRVKGQPTVASRVAEYGSAVRSRLGPAFSHLGVAYPPWQATLVGLKAERQLEVWVAGPDGRWRYLKTYPILGLSGKLGPKLAEGDMQVPEGCYGVESLNPNSNYHLALRLNYPNTDDRARGKEDGRVELGSAIMIHGRTASAGCLAMGDEAAEDLFVLAAETSIDRVRVILSPVDFRVQPLPVRIPAVPAWAGALYASLKAELQHLGQPPATAPAPGAAPTRAAVLQQSGREGE